jgi:hypothetical protein
MEISREVVIDQLSVHEDLAGKTGSLVGPSQIAEFIKPYYRRIWDLLSSRGTKIFQQDPKRHPDRKLPLLCENRSRDPRSRSGRSSRLEPDGLLIRPNHCDGRPVPGTLEAASCRLNAFACHFFGIDEASWQ